MYAIRSYYATISGLTIEENKQDGIQLNYNCNLFRVENNTIQNNQGIGISINAVNTQFQGEILGHTILNNTNGVYVKTEYRTYNSYTGYKYYYTSPIIKLKQNSIHDNTGSQLVITSYSIHYTKLYETV